MMKFVIFRQKTTKSLVSIAALERYPIRISPERPASLNDGLCGFIQSLQKNFILLGFSVLVTVSIKHSGKSRSGPKYYEVWQSHPY
jgi:hypothetical protein